MEKPAIDHRYWQKLNVEIHQRFRQGRFRVMNAKGKIVGEVDKEIPISYSTKNRTKIRASQ